MDRTNKNEMRTALKAAVLAALVGIGASMSAAAMSAAPSSAPTSKPRSSRGVIGIGVNGYGDVGGTRVDAARTQDSVDLVNRTHTQHFWVTAPPGRGLTQSGGGAHVEAMHFTGSNAASDGATLAHPAVRMSRGSLASDPDASGLADAVSRAGRARFNGWVGLDPGAAGVSVGFNVRF